MVSGRGRRNERRNKLEKGRREKRGRGSRNKLRKKCEVSSVDCLSRREVGICSRSGTETDKDPGKVVKPIRSGRPGTEGGCEAVVKTLNKTVGLRMVLLGSGGLMSDVEKMTEVEPEQRCELWAAVRSDDRRHAKL